MVTTAADLVAGFHARYPNAGESVTGITLSAAAEPGTVASVEASSVTNYSSVSGPLQFVQAVEHFRIGGKVIVRGDFVQVREDDAKRLVHGGRAIFATDEEAFAAQKGKGK